MKINNKLISIVSMLLVALVLFSTNKNTGHRVIRVVDGDTIIVAYEEKEERVRLIGIDTPESVHNDERKNTDEGKIASDFTKAKLEGKYVDLEFDVERRDQYDRLLAYVWLEDEMFNRVLLEEGYAKTVVFPPNIKYLDDFKILERQAKEDKKGLWATRDLFDEKTETLGDKISGKYKASKNGDKYHLGNYSHDGQISPKNIIWFDSIKEAEKKGYKPCGICFN